MSVAINVITASDAWEKLCKGEPCQIVDVREPSEYSAEHIIGSTSLPLSILDPEKTSSLDRSKNIFLLCRAGGRARKAADILAESGLQNIAVIDGGIQAWIAAGCPVEHEKSKVWSLERQVRFTAGTLVLTGIILGMFVSGTWLLLSLFVAAGMMFSAATDTCGMAMLLAHMPWNKQAPSCNTRAIPK